MDQAGIPRIRQFIAKYAYVLLTLLLGIVLMLLPTSSREKTEQPVSTPEQTVPEPESLQEQLSAVLSLVDGAGRVKVLLTIANGEKVVYQTDTDTSRSDTVVLSDNDRNQSGLICQVDPPRYQGAVVLCQGADNAAIRLAITQAVANATGLGYDKITILKMK